MPRLNSGQELLQYLLPTVKKVVEATGTHGNTTTTGAIVADDATVDITATTNFTAADLVFIIGDGGTELTTIGTPATTDCPVTRPLLIAQASGAQFVEALGINIGHISEAGITFGGSYTLTPINASTSRTAIAFFPGAAELTFNFNLLGYNNLNLQTAFGATEGEAGVGTAADPYAVLIGPTTVATQSTMVFRFQGTRLDGDMVEVDLLASQIEVNVSAIFGAPAPDGLPVAGKCAAIAQRIWTP